MNAMNVLRKPLTTARRDRGYVLLAVLTLALGLGATVTLFAVVNGVLLESLPFPDSDRLVVVDHAAPALDLERMGTSRRLYLHYREQARTIQEIGLYDATFATLTGDGEPLRVQSSTVTPSFFRALGTEPQLGRAFAEEEGSPGAAPVVVLADRLWRVRYGADGALLGRTIPVDGIARQVIGIMPPGFAFPERDTELWAPREIDPANVELGAFHDSGIARLAPGADLEASRADLERLSSDLASSFPEDRAAPVLDRAGFSARVDPLLEVMVSEVRQVLWVLLGTVAVILLIACANVANLFLVRVEERSSELAIRSALGASRGRLARALLAESLTLSLVAGAAGLLLATGALSLIRRFGPQDVPRLEEVAVNARVVLFALGAALAAGLLFGLLPALRGTARHLVSGLREGGRGASASRQRHLLRNALVGAQVALGLVMLITSGLLVRTLLELRRVDPGFDPESALTFRVTLPEVEYPAGEQRVQLIEQALERFRALPGVAAAGVASYLPLTGVGNGSGYRIEGRNVEDEMPPVFMQTYASPGYLESVRARLVEGRFFEPDDYRLRTGNLIVSQSIARELWPGESALGKRLRPGGPEGAPWYTVTGVLEDLRHLQLSEEPRHMVHLPLLGLEPGEEEDVTSNLSFVLRTQVEPTSLISAARSELWSLDPKLPITQVRTLEQIVRESRAQTAFAVVILLVASALALGLASVGLFGVISYVVSRRSHEIGVRLALGAQRGEVTALVLRGGLLVSVVGVGVGLLLAVATTRLFESLLFGVGTLDPLTFVLVSLLLVAVSLLASYAPAARAARIDPARALREE